MFLKLACDPDERWDMVSDQLRDDRTSRGVLGDGRKNPRVQTGVLMDSEIFCKIQVRAAVAVDEPQKWQVGDILHWCQNEQRFRFAEEGGKLF
jgi:hypothetical protein